MLRNLYQLQIINIIIDITPYLSFKYKVYFLKKILVTFFVDFNYVNKKRSLKTYPIKNTTMNSMKTPIVPYLFILK